MNVYENVYIMQMGSLLCMIPAAYYMLRVYRYHPKVEGNVLGYTIEGYKKLFMRMMVYMATGTAAMINCKVY
jgi:hypothetical protein